MNFSDLWPQVVYCTIGKHLVTSLPSSYAQQMIKTNSQSIVRTCVTWGYVGLCHSCDYPMTLPWHSYYHHMIVPWGVTWSWHDKAITVIWSSHDHHMTVPRGLHGHQWLTMANSHVTITRPSHTLSCRRPSRGQCTLNTCSNSAIFYPPYWQHPPHQHGRYRRQTYNNSFCCHGNNTSCANFIMASQVWGLVL